MFFVDRALLYIIGCSGSDRLASSSWNHLIIPATPTCRTPLIADQRNVIPLLTSAVTSLHPNLLTMPLHARRHKRRICHTPITIHPFLPLRFQLVSLRLHLLARLPCGSSSELYYAVFIRRYSVLRTCRGFYVSIMHSMYRLPAPYVSCCSSNQRDVGRRWIFKAMLYIGRYLPVRNNGWRGTHPILISTPSRHARAENLWARVCLRV